MTHTLISKQQWLFSTLFIFISSVALSQKEGQLSFLFAGDVMQHGPQIEGALNKVSGKYEYDNSLKFIKPIIQSVDVAIANLEVTHAGKPYSGYPQFSAPDELSYALKNVGFDVLLTCNNHSCDGGGKGVIRTLDVLDKVGIIHTGTFRNKQERDANYPLIIDKHGMKVAILNYTYGTNGLVVPAPIVINYIDSAVMRADFAKAKKMADYVICTMHWGAEYQALPNAYQKNYEKFCYELGADMVIGSHPHVIQPVERKKLESQDVLTAWSLGNFVSNQRDRYKNGGMLVQATLENSSNSDGKGNNVLLKDANYWLFYVHKRIEGIFKPYYVLPEYDYNSSYANFMNPSELTIMQEFFTDSRLLMKKYGKNIEEITLKDLNTSGYYEKTLKGYYSVLVGAGNGFSSDNKELMHKIIGTAGEEVWLSGYCNSVEETAFIKHILTLLGEYKPMQTVFITPDGYNIVSK